MSAEMNNSSTSSINYGYGDPEDVVPKMNSKNNSKRKDSGGFRVSSLPAGLRDSVAKMKLDKNGDGELDNEEIGQVVDNLAATHKVNKTLKMMVLGLCVFAVLLVACVFGASIAAARLSKDTDVDSLTGIMYAKSSNGDETHSTIMKTEAVVFQSVSVSSNTIMEKSNTQLKDLNEILLSDNDVKFQIKGYARAKDNTYITLLVEGGTLVFDIDGLASATGNAKILLDSAFGEGEEVEGVGGGQRRYLASASNSCKAPTVSRRNLASASASASAEDCGVMTVSGQTACIPDAPIDIVIPTCNKENCNPSQPIHDIQGLYICCGCGQNWEYFDGVYNCVGTITTGKFCG
jgi:hypothetical protein